MAFEDIDDEFNDLTAAAQAAMFDEAMAREARHDAREPDPPPAAEDPDGPA